jgi:transposase, IS5 family
MIRRRNAQRTFGDVILFGAAMPEPESLMHPDLRCIDRLLDDEVMVDAVLAGQRRRSPRSACRGRRSTPAEVVLRMLALKHLKDWTYEELEWEVKSNIAYRRFCRIDAGKVADATTMVRQAKLLNEDALKALLDRVVGQAIDAGATAGRKMRIDTTVVEASIHYPTDSGLCEDAVRVLSRAVRRLAALGIKLKAGFSNVSRSVGRRMREIAQAARLRGDAARAAVKRPYRRLLQVTARVIRQAEAAASKARGDLKSLRGARRRRAEKQVVQIALFAPRARQVVRQARARVMRGVTDSAGKLISLFEPEAQILRRGKPHKPTEFGELVKVQEAEGGIVTDVGLVPDKADAPLLVPAVERHATLFGRAPRLVATDRGFYSDEGERRIKELGVKRPVIPKPGGKSKERTAYERQRWFKKGRAWRAGGEARIARLKHTFGMDKSRYRGRAGIQRTVYWAAIANNLVALARVR